LDFAGCLFVFSFRFHVRIVSYLSDFLFDFAFHFMKLAFRLILRAVIHGYFSLSRLSWPASIPIEHVSGRIYKNRTGRRKSGGQPDFSGLFQVAMSRYYFPDIQSSKDLAHEKNSKAPEGATAGVAAGGAAGGALGLLVGIGALAIPGLGPSIAAGPIVAALAGLGVGGAVGGMVGALAGMGIPEYEAKLYMKDMSRRAASCFRFTTIDPKEVSRAKDIPTYSGATDIASTGEATADAPKPLLPAIT
jgi:hypothetical protein